MRDADLPQAHELSDGAFVRPVLIVCANNMTRIAREEILVLL
ncbi:acyl-CoA reductase-like NAD-dependent aldehyde dehydrogenase [Paenochrobactrum gallinarii]|uniref:Acyl-CoA reductase-like NAD-dependent aldehyde dehydrogenase n=1 Tax=Paenochrobactrum gallinarii TaxID=643673 RepID=A0A841LY51_9HYPH|nr:hypothetical protein [Paenochrobactrum gallinarii]MBB6261437.1 acyl-CoA reductase-like NAD-dependent aldehyde dehydrogenase [Paenochrobactrum gallinarii]